MVTNAPFSCALDCGVMFVREKKRRNQDLSALPTGRQAARQAARSSPIWDLVENNRVEGKTRQRVLCTLGRADDPKLQADLGRLVTTARRYAEEQALVVDASTRVETKTWGGHLVWGRLWEETLSPVLAEALFPEHLAQEVYLMVLGRLVDPQSKCATYAWSGDVYGAGFEDIEIHDLYRALDVLSEKKEDLERGWFARHRDLFTDTDLLYFDTTSTYLEGTHPEGLAAFGYSRDKRPDRRQLALGVVVTRDGLPVAHLLLLGNTADPVAFREALVYLREVLGVTRAVLCCDRGMVSEGNLQAMREAGLPYIVDTRLRGDKRVTAEVLARAGRYPTVAENLQVKEVKLEDVGDRYIVCLSPLGAEEDRKNQDGILAHLEEKLAGGTAQGLLRGAARRYVRLHAGVVTLDRAKVAEDARCDGKWVLRTNTDLPAEEAALAYKGLWQVEQAFRVLKAPLELRPIYHQTEKRIRGHVMVYFLAFVLRQLMNKRLTNLGWAGSFTELLSALERVRVSVLRGKGGQTFRLRDEIPTQAMPAFHACLARQTGRRDPGAPEVRAARLTLAPPDSHP
jgi:hypothetical protein